MIKSYVFIDLNCFSQVSDVAHGPLGFYAFAKRDMIEPLKRQAVTFLLV